MRAVNVPVADHWGSGSRRCPDFSSVGVPFYDGQNLLCSPAGPHVTQAYGPLLCTEWEGTITVSDDSEKLVGEAVEPVADDGHWFAGKDLSVLIYKVNRRPLSGDPQLFEPPGDVYEHLKLVLAKPATVRRAKQRAWRIGNKRWDDDKRTLVGVLGWGRSAETLMNVWDESTQSWVDRYFVTDVSAASPFAFRAQGRYIGVLRHPSFSEETVALVLTNLLNRGERALAVPTTAWAVEPVGNEDEFQAWLDSADRVTEVKFVFKRPNPDAESDFQNLFQRLDAHRAGVITQDIKAADRDLGLDKAAVRADSVNRAFLTAAMLAFGYVVGHGYRGGKRHDYDQRHNTLREPVETVSADWDGVMRDVLGAVERAWKRGRNPVG